MKIIQKSESEFVNSFIYKRFSTESGIYSLSNIFIQKLIRYPRDMSNVFAYNVTYNDV